MEPFIRTFEIDGKQTSKTTFRTGIVEHFTKVEGRTFLDLGAGDGYESRALAYRGAKMATAVEGKDKIFKLAFDAQESLKLPNHEVKQLDVRRIDEYGLDKADVTLCFGFLYHLENPFNVLKRIKNVTKDVLLLETHVAPERPDVLVDKHVNAFRGDVCPLYMDGALFQGMYRPHYGDPRQTKGSLDADWTFWLTAESLMKAVLWAGFDIIDYHYEPDSTSPEAIRKWGGIQGFGFANTKVLIVAKPKNDTPVEVCEPVLSSAPNKIVPPGLPPYPPLGQRVFRKVARMIGLCE